MAFSPDGALLGAAGEADRLLVVGFPDAAPVGPPISAPGFLTTGLVFAADSATMFWGIRDDGTLGEWTVDGPGPLGRAVTPPSDATVVAVAVAPDGTIAAGNPDGTITVAGRTLHHELRGQTTANVLAVLAFDGSTLVSAGGDGSVVRWTHATDTRPGQQETGQEASAVALSANGRRAAFASFDDRVRVVEVGGERRVLLDIPEGPENIRGLALDTAGSMLAMGDEGGGVRVVSVDDGIAPRTLTGHDNYVRALAFSPDGSVLASASDDGTLLLHDTASGTPRGPALTLGIDDNPDDDSLRSAAFSPDGALVAIGAEQNRVALVDVATGRRFGPALDARPAAVSCAGRPCDPTEDVTFATDGALVVGTGAEGAVRWDLDPDHWPAAVCARAATASARDAIDTPPC